VFKITKAILKKAKIILYVGQTGAGKTLAINALANYHMGIS